MKILIRNDSVVIEGYVNAVERNSNPLVSRIGRFIERIRKGAFSNALKRSDDVHLLLNHDWNKDWGSLMRGNLELAEDNIGLFARATITEPEGIEKARRGDFVGWSFGFKDVPNGVEVGTEKGMMLREVKDLDLKEVSILDRTRKPAYDGTLIWARSEEDIHFRSDEFIDEVEVIDETDETREIQPQQEEHPEAIKVIDYSIYDSMIAEMKGEK